MPRKTGCFNDIRVFVVCYGLLFLTDIMAGVMKKSSLTTIERRFNLPSTITALLASSFQIGTLTMLLFVSYFGSRWHRPRAIFLGSILLVVGNLIVTLPQFLGGRYEYEDISSNTSSSSSKVTECAVSNDDAETEAINCDEKNPTNNLYIFLVVGMMVNGVGGSALQPLSYSYIDDFAHERNSPFYLGITQAISLIGPMLGYIASSIVLKLWVDIGWVDISTITITPTHPSWVGAWWLGLLVCTSGIAVTMMPFPYFPKKMQKQEYKGKKSKKVITDDETKEHEDEKNSIEIKNTDDDAKMEKGSAVSREAKAIVKTVKSMASNKLFLLILLKMYFGNAAFTGIANFFPKYLEVGFGVSASRANFLTGVINIPCVVVGVLIGGLIMKRYNLGTVGTAKLIAAATFGASVTIAPMLFIGCETISVAGITTPYADGTSENLPSVDSACNADCSCSSGSYAPICGSDGISYVSPCHAGCTGAMYNDDGMKQNFTNCGCIRTEGHGNISWAKPERCQLSNCGHLVHVALAFKSAASLFAGIAATPMSVFLMRSVEKDQKALAIGVYLLIIRVLAWIPGPVVYGALIDSACLYWGKKPCSKRAYCKIYDNTAYRHRFYSLIVAFNFLSCITAIVLYNVVKKQPSTKENSTTQPPKGETLDMTGVADNGNEEAKLVPSREHSVEGSV